MNQRNSSTTWALLLGCLCFVAGGTLAVSKYIDPAFGEYASSIGRAMANGGTLGLFGLVLIAVYTSTSSGPSSSKESGEAQKSGSGADQSLVLEQLASDMAQVRGQLETLRKAQESAAAPTKSESEPLNTDDRLFRLAAGIDQLGARVDGRLKTQHGATMDAIDGLGREVQALLERVAELESNTNGGFERLSHTLVAGGSTTEHAATEDATTCVAETRTDGVDFGWSANCGLPDGDCTSEEYAARELVGVDAGTERGTSGETACTTTECATGAEEQAASTIDDGVWYMPPAEPETTTCATDESTTAPVWTMDEPVVAEDFVGDVEACGTQGTAPEAVCEGEGDPYAATPEPEIELAQGFESSDDDFDVSVELEPETETVAADCGTNGLGILDTIDAPQAALPQPQPETDGTVDSKLATLMELMGDPAVRKALEALQRGK